MISSRIYDQNLNFRAIFFIPIVLNKDAKDSWLSIYIDDIEVQLWLALPVIKSPIDVDRENQDGTLTAKIGKTG